MTYRSFNRKLFIHRSWWEEPFHEANRLRPPRTARFVPIGKSRRAAFRTIVINRQSKLKLFTKLAPPSLNRVRWMKKGNPFHIIYILRKFCLNTESIYFQMRLEGCNSERYPNNLFPFFVCFYLTVSVCLLVCQGRM